MPIETIKYEVLCYTGKRISTQEAEEIRALWEEYPEASLAEFICGYYDC